MRKDAGWKQEKKRLGSDLADLSIKLERVLLIWGVDKKLERVYSKM
jgi:hypothetical protein